MKTCRVVPVTRSTAPQRSTRKRAVATQPTQLSTYTHHKRAAEGTTVEWYTPPQLVKACGGPGGFDLDPCTPAVGTLPCKTARKRLTPVQDGLATPWDPADFVWLNPPYGRGIERWMEKLANHPGGGVALVPDSTDTRWAHDFAFSHPNATAVLFVKGRIRFHDHTGTAGKPASFGSMFVAYGERAARNVQAMVDQGIANGRVLRLTRNKTFAVGSAANDA